MPNKKRQALVKTILCHHWGKYNLKNSTFTLESAHQLLVSLQSKKSDNSVKAKFKIYDSGFKIVKKGPFGKTEKIPFQSINRFFVFKTEPHLIFFGVEKRKRLTYTVILFRELDQINEICDLTERKKLGQGKINPINEIEVVTYHDQVESAPEIPKVTYELVNNETQCDPVEEKVIYIQSSDIEIKTPVLHRNIEFHYNDYHTDDMGTTKVDALLLRTNKDKGVNIDQWKEDMQYLDYNPEIGSAELSEVGPIYMYTAHFTPAEYHTFGSCESDDSDSWSEDSMSSSDNQGMVTKTNGKTVIMAHRGSDAGIAL